jgi:CRISPR/Cas system-associated exonuclease Cas4 (RecB family)
MIRSGLVNQRKGGGFQQGFPHQRDNTPRDEVLRPYVDGFDTGMGKPSNPKVVIPQRVSYAKIFSKNTTPDERLYLLKMVEKGVKKISEQLDKGRPDVESLPLPGNQNGGPTLINPNPADIPNPPPVENPPDPNLPDDGDSFPGVTDVTSVAPVGFPDLIKAEDLYADELKAQDVVFPPLHEPTYEENEKHTIDWMNDIPYGVVHSNSHSGSHKGDDVTPANQNPKGFEYDAISGSYHTAKGSSAGSVKGIYPTVPKGDGVVPVVSTGSGIMQTRNGFEKDAKLVEVEYDPYKKVERERSEGFTIDTGSADRYAYLEKKFKGSVKKFYELPEPIAKKASVNLTEEEKEKIDTAVKILKKYEQLTPAQRRYFVETLDNDDYQMTINYLSFVESAPGSMGYISDTSLLEYMHRKVNELPMTRKTKGYVEEIVPKTYVAKIVNLNGVGPRQRVSAKKVKGSFSVGRSRAPRAPRFDDNMDVDEINADFRGQNIPVIGEPQNVEGGGYLTKGGKPKSMTRISNRATLKKDVPGKPKSLSKLANDAFKKKSRSESILAGTRRD